MIVNEAGASVYSASKLAAEEFPEYDVNLRSAVSIARRLQDPLAELVKIDPKAIGVGQYQHDMPQKRLDETLSGVVEDCVNAVGVDVNTASASLLGRVSGLNATTAKNIVNYREENGAFTARRQLLKVPKLGPKAFEQCAGFLRVPESSNRAGQHRRPSGELRRGGGSCWPCAAIRLADVSAGGLGGPAPEGAGHGRRRRPPGRCGVGVPTLRDMVAELVKPGRDLRDELPRPHSAHRRAGDEGPEARHGADGHGPQCHRLRRVRGHRRPPGRAGPHLPGLQQVHPPPVGLPYLLKK